MEPLPVNFGDYVLLDRIGSGGMAEIFLAEGPAAGGGEARLVIKRILPHLSSDEQFVKMFVEEARLCLALRHPNIVEVFDLGKADDQYFIAMEYVDGKDLLKTLGACAKKRIPFPTDLALFIITEVLRGLDYAHNLRGPDGRHLGIIHRDVSPSNVFLGMDGRVKIGDFGIAKASTREKTAAGVLKGKFGYMAPEQVMGRPLDHRADVFAVGILLYELLTGHRLFAGKSDILVLERVRQAIVDPPPRHYRPDLSYELERVVLKALAREPDDRFRSTAALHDALRDYVAKAGVSLGPRLLVRFMAELFADGKLPANLPPMPSAPPPGETDRWSDSPNTANERLSLESSAPIPESTYDGDGESATNDLESSWSREGETQDELVRPKELDEEPSEHTEIAARHLPSVVSEPLLPSRLMVRGVDPAEALGPSRDADHETHTAKGAPTPFGGVPVARLGEEARRPKIEPPSARLLLDSNGELRSDEEGSPWDSSSTHEEHQLEPVEEPSDEKERTALLDPPPVDEDEETSALDRRQVAEAVAPSFLAPSPPTRTSVRADSQGGFELSFGAGRDSPESSTAELDDLGASTMIKAPGKVADTLPPPPRSSDPWPSRASVDAEALAEEAARLPSAALRPGALHREPSLPSAVRAKPGGTAIPPQETVRLVGGDEPPELAHEPTNFGPLIEDRILPRAASVDDALDESQEVDAEVRRLVSSSGSRDRDDRTVGGDLAGLLGVSISQIVAPKAPSDAARREPSSTRIGRLDRPKNAREAELSGALDRLHSDQDSLSSFDPEEEASLAATGSGEDESAPSLGIGVPVALDPTRPPARPPPSGRRPVFDEPTAALPDLDPRAPSLAVEDTRLRPLEPEPKKGRGAPPTPPPTPAAPPLDPAEARPSAPPRMSTAAEKRVRAVVERHRAVKEFKRHSVAPPAAPPRPAPPPMPSLPPTADALPPMVPTATAMLPKPAAAVAVSDSEVVVPGIQVSQAAALGTDMRLAIIFAVMALVLVGVLVLLKSRSGVETEALPIPIQPAPRSAATDPVDIPSPEEAEALEARRAPPGRLRVPCRTPVELDVPGVGRIPAASGAVVELPEGTYLIDVHSSGPSVAKRSVRIQAGAETTLVCP